MAKPFQRFTDQDREFLKANFDSMTSAQLAAAIDRTEAGICDRVFKSKLSTNH